MGKKRASNLGVRKPVKFRMGVRLEAKSGGPRARSSLPRRDPNAAIRMTRRPRGPQVPSAAQPFPLAGAMSVGRTPMPSGSTAAAFEAGTVLSPCFQVERAS